jgi:hypothetical protein
MQKAAEDLRNEAKAKAEEKERYINERVGVLSLEGKAEGTSDVVLHDLLIFLNYCPITSVIQFTL